MPGMDGIEFIRHMGDSQMPVALIVASDQDRAIVDSVANMARAYGVNLLAGMQKPITAKKLAAALAGYEKKAKVTPETPRQFTLPEICQGIDKGEFEPFYQPKMDLVTGRIHGAEALARWRHPQHGVLGPQSFIKALETSWQIDDLTLVMMRKAATCCRAWRALGAEATVSVNVSLTSLTDLTLADRLTEIVREHLLEPRDFVLEVTETAAASHLGKVLENLSRLRMKGFGLAIDDYGTGYSSMQELTRSPFTELKIDQSFVQNAPSSAASRAVLESGLEMAAKLDISCVAEGVETKEHVLLLRELNCEQAQGFYIAKPMAGGDFLRWLQQAGRGERQARV
jgi:EAL domain-containing protein (putative c-di-GMP-specific phosphodiesterase class I)